MADKSKISWTDASWTIVAGCARVSPGCAHCYAVRDSWRLAANTNPRIADAYAGTVERQPNGQLDWTGLVRPLPERLDWPLRWQRPRRVFVCSMADLFHPDVPESFLDQVFAVMALCPRHTFQILTKRPACMCAYVNAPGRLRRVLDAGVALLVAGKLPRIQDELPPGQGAWPLPNVWVGTSTEDQPRANERIPPLLQTPAAVHFVSAEPLLGPLYLTPRLSDTHNRAAHLSEHLTDGHWHDDCGFCHNRRRHGGNGIEPGIDWVIVGGESGPEYRPMQTDWARSLRDQCQAAGTAFYFKQGNGLRAGSEPTLDGVTWHDYPNAEEGPTR